LGRSQRVTASPCHSPKKSGNPSTSSLAESVLDVTDVENTLTFQYLVYFRETSPSHSPIPLSISTPPLPLLGVLITKDPSLVQSSSMRCNTFASPNQPSSHCMAIKTTSHSHYPSMNYHPTLMTTTILLEKSTPTTTSSTPPPNIKSSTTSESIQKVIASPNKYLHRAMASFGSCLGFLCDLTNGTINQNVISWTLI